MKPTCSPANQEKNETTCYTTKSLLKLKQLWNARHSDDKITTNEPLEIWNELRQRFTGVCQHEKCWLRHTFISNKIGHDILHYTFAPDAPKSWKKNPNEWLSNYDITSVMQQYEYKYNHFAFIGPSPIDFDKRIVNDKCVWDDLCEFNLSKCLKKGKRKIGVIFNTDPHNKGGEHWVSLFIDTTHDNPYIFYFDSAGDPILPEILLFAQRVIQQASKLNIHKQLYENHPLQHQKSTTECGMYSLYMIIQLLTNTKTYTDFMTKRIPDKEIEHYRYTYFNHV